MFQASPDQFDLVITDQTMPGLTGESLAKSLRQMPPISRSFYVPDSAM